MPPTPFPWVFNFEEELRVEGEDFLRKPFMRPVVLVRLVGERVGDHNLAALVDSGCDHIVCAPWVAQDIGVEPDPNREIRVRIGGARRPVRFADVSVRLLPPATLSAEGSHDADQAHEWQAQVGFFTEWKAPPWNVLLGQIGFFDQFTVTMNRESQALAITDLEDFDRRFPQRPAEADAPPSRIRI